VQRLLVVALGSPQQRPGIVIDDHAQIAMPSAEAHLIDADAAQSLQVLQRRTTFLDDTLDDAPNRCPVDSHELRDGAA
jgi:hypothetical protein